MKLDREEPTKMHSSIVRCERDGRGISFAGLGGKHTAETGLSDGSGYPSLEIILLCLFHEMMIDENLKW